MADPCAADTPYIGLDTSGTPAVLEATLLNPETTFSGTEGDDTTHVVTDNDTPHIQTQTYIIDNSAGTAPSRGIIVVALNPIWAGQADGPGASLLVEASLTIAGHPTFGDQRDVITVPMDTGVIALFSLGSLVGTFDVAAGATQSITYEKRITNDGASVQWSFRMGGDKVVAQMGY